MRADRSAAATTPGDPVDPAATPGDPVDPAATPGDQDSPASRRSGHAARHPARWWPAVPPLVAVAAVGLGIALGWRGTDVPAAMHRIMELRSHGYTLWDGSWYGGQWTLDYSVAFAPVAAALGLPALGLVSAGLSALSFERIVSPHLGPGARPAAVVFAVGTAVETAIGQYPFLAGEAVALAAVWAMTRRRWPAAWALALASSLVSPLAGAFAALAAVTWLAAQARAGRHPTAAGRQEAPARHRPAPDRGWRWAAACAGVAVAAAVPVVATSVAFPGEGVMPFQGLTFVWDVAIAAVVGAVTPRRHRVLRTGVVLYIVVLAGSFVLQTPVGVNAGRLEDCSALPLLVAVLWPTRRQAPRPPRPSANQTARWRSRGARHGQRRAWPAAAQPALLVALAVPLLLSGWGPAWGAVTTIPGQPSAHRAFYAPLVAWLSRADPGGVDGRVEVVPTAYHAEAEWVAAAVPLARGWERQTDMSDNPIFYRRGALDDRTYLSWLRSNGVRYVALPAAPIDFAGAAEARLVAAGVPGLRPVWRDARWRVWAVTASPGIASPARVTRLGQAAVILTVAGPGTVTVRVRWNEDWHLTAGSGCVRAAPGGWTALQVPSAETVRLAVRWSGAGPCRRAGGGGPPTG